MLPHSKKRGLPPGGQVHLQLFPMAGLAEGLERALYKGLKITPDRRNMIADRGGGKPGLFSACLAEGLAGQNLPADLLPCRAGIKALSLPAGEGFFFCYVCKHDFLIPPWPCGHNGALESHVLEVWRSSVFPSKAFFQATGFALPGGRLLV